MNYNKRKDRFNSDSRKIEFVLLFGSNLDEFL